MVLTWQQLKHTTMPTCQRCQHTMTPYRIHFTRAVFLCPEHCAHPLLPEVALSCPPLTTDRLTKAAATCTVASLPRKRRRVAEKMVEEKMVEEKLTTDAPFPLEVRTQQADENQGEEERRLEGGGCDPAWLKILFGEEDGEELEGASCCGEWSTEAWMDELG
eukprot:TRINITY_DN2878_c0_g1_i2.p1 TRINITY_DN2878_c0_g1~~TRINITY_DN2878_c0_g1_i2.p1  ORF type:complete len:162 (+),score=36.99 TRINITY_DN2878_c0_g1_i2:233-718(+)